MQHIEITLSDQTLGNQPSKDLSRHMALYLALKNQLLCPEQIEAALDADDYAAERDPADTGLTVRWRSGGGL